MIRRIVVVRAGALGDVVLTLPLIRALGERYPEARIEAAGYPRYWEVAGPLVDATLDVEKAAFAGLLTGIPSPDLTAWLAGSLTGSDPVDLIVAFTNRTPNSALRSGGVREIIHASPYPPPGIHAAAWYLQQFDLAPPAGPTLSFSSREQEVARRMLADRGMQRPILLAPGAGAPWKRWPADRYGELALALRERAYDVGLIEGPADGEAVEATIGRAGMLPVIRTAPVRELGAILGQATLLVGNDSGVCHLAAAAGTPAVALFGPTDPASWAPLGDGRVVRTCTARATRQGQIRVCEDPGCMAGITVEAALDAVLDVAGRALP